MTGPSDVISLPHGGGALAGIGEKFAPDLHTGTGNFTVPLAVPPGRNGLQPQLNLVYSSGAGNGPFGLGWSLSLPGVSRQTAKGVPRYDEDRDVYVLSGAEDLEPVGTGGAVTRYRPRTEGLFARILRHRSPGDSHWEVRSKDGLVTTYGNPGAFPDDLATVADPADRERVYAWKITQTADPHGNHVAYEYQRDTGGRVDDPHRWDVDDPRRWAQVYVARIRYADHGPDRMNPPYLVSVTFEYEERPDSFSNRRAGFEIRTRLRCARIVVRSHTDAERLVRSYELDYVDQLGDDSRPQPPNGVSLLARLRVTGHDEGKTESMPPLEFRYSGFEPAKRKFIAAHGAELPGRSLTDPDLELVDLSGNGLPDVVQLNGAARRWRNRGDGRFDTPRPLRSPPAGVRLADPGVRFLDANGDGRADLMVTNGPLAGYFPMRADVGWDNGSFRRFGHAPSFNLADPEVRLVDLDGDGVTDAIRSGTRLECFFNDPLEGWTRTRAVPRRALASFPDVSFSDPRVRWADFTGDGLQDVSVIYDRNVEYWPSLGLGDWGPRISMGNAPKFPYGYDPKRILIGDVDGDGLADLVYVGDDDVTVWINRGGDAWSDPITVRAHGGDTEREFRGTPPVADGDVRLIDLLGSGIEGVLWSRDARRAGGASLHFLDFTGGRKPYLLEEMDNHTGAVTNVEYAPSTRYYAEDDQLRETRWRTTLPFPVQVVAKVTVRDHFSGGTLTTRYRYRHGHWDGAEREFRGFAMVEQRDAEIFGGAGPAPARDTPPTLTRTWFHPGPVGNEFGGWSTPDFADEYWPGDPSMLDPPDLPPDVATPEGRRIRRDALRALRGSVLRTELYAEDGTERESRPYSVTESGYAVAEIDVPPAGAPARRRIFFPHAVAQRTTTWERGDDPMTGFSFTRYTDDGGTFDPYGRPRATTAVACPRGWRSLAGRPAERYLVTHTRTGYAVPDAPGTYIHDRVAATTTFEITATEGMTVHELAAADFNAAGGPGLRVDGHSVNYYDGEAFAGLPRGRLGEYGAAVRVESLVLTEEILASGYGADVPPYLISSGIPAWTADYPAEFRALLPPGAGYVYRAAGAGQDEPGGWFAQTARHRYDFHTAPASAGRGLVLETRDALWHPGDPDGHRAAIAYDDYGLLPVLVTDAAALTTSAQYDYRVFQPSSVTDPNGAVSRFTFTPLGLVASTATRGQTAAEGDQTRPGARLEYAFTAYDDSPPEARQPINIRTIRHIHHDTDADIPLPERDDTITTVEYSDGFGRMLQTRIEGEDVRFGDPAFGGGAAVLPPDQSANAGEDVTGHPASPDAAPVVVSGSTVYDNKGRVAEVYEPYFAAGWNYGPPLDAETGRKVTTLYDPLGRAVRTIQPDGAEQRVVHGVPGTLAEPDLTNPDACEPTPWEAYTYDANDNAGRTHPATSASYRHHYDTPTSIRLDARGQTVEAVARDREAPANPGGPLPPILEYHTHTTYDIRGNPLQVTDALGRLAFRHSYDLANRPLRVTGADSGVRSTVFHAGGGVVEQRDGRGALQLQGYDSVNRPIRTWAREAPNDSVRLVGRTQFGDGGTPGQDPSERASARVAYRLGRPYRQWDGAGLLTLDGYDFKGALREKTRQVVADEVLTAAQPFHPDWQDPAATVLEAAVYATSTRYDALGRVLRLTFPEDVEGGRRALIPHYNRAGALEAVALERSGPGGAPILDTYVERIAYDAKGQRVLISYGNGVITRYAHDPDTTRLIRLRTERFTKPADLAYRPAGPVQQDLAYAYDAAGNVLAITDRTPGCGIPATPLGADALDRKFAYDPLYRLRSATGRECDIPPATPWDPASRCVDRTRTRSYTETYSYDPLGGLLELKHLASGAGATRSYALAPDSNRLQAMTVNGDTTRYDYDANGNLTRESLSRHFEWDYADRLREYRNQAGAGPASLVAQYFYDAAGQRVKKLVRAGGKVTVTVYVDGSFERCRTFGVGSAVENDTLHVTDGKSRIALVRLGPTFPHDATPAVQYQLGDHLGSSHVVLDASGSGVSHEEYTPYGDTAFGGHTLKRYRYSGKERDEESGLYYYGYRYYAPWLTRWTSPDPAGPVDGLNLYAFVRANPMRLSDTLGLQNTDNIADAGTPDVESSQTSGAGPAAGSPPTPVNAIQAGAPVVSGARLATAQANIPTSTTGEPLSGTLHLWSGAGKADAKAAIASSGSGWIAKAAIASSGSGWMMSQTPEHAEAKAAFVQELRMAAEQRFPNTSFSEDQLFALADQGKIAIDPIRFREIWDEASAAVVRKAILSNGAVQQHQSSPGTVQARIEKPTVWKFSGIVGGAAVLSGGLQILGAAYEDNPYLKSVGFAAGGAEIAGGVTYGVGAYFVSGSTMAVGGGLMTTGTYGGMAVAGATSVRISIEASKEMNKTITQGEQNGTYPAWFRDVFNATRIGMAFSGM